jgi:hypothetical protein
MSIPGLEVDTSTKPLHSVKKFYFLEYFYVLLSSIEKYSHKRDAFDLFKTLKQERGLGDSKYKVKIEEENLSPARLNKYLYTFEQVIDEATEYNLIIEHENEILLLTATGENLLKLHRTEGPQAFNQALFRLMENDYHAFRYLVKFLYEANKYRPGLLIFPIYSPLKLNYEKSNVKTTAHIIEYSKALTRKLEQDINTFLGKRLSLKSENSKLLERLMSNGLISTKASDTFDPSKYNVITKRIRDYWLNHFLQELYKYEYEPGRYGSLSSFDIWTYRGKQLGIIHATEFYPDPEFNGRIVYPTSVILKATKSKDFEQVFEYSDGTSLYLHKPIGDENQNKFVDFLVKAYFNLRRTNRSYFVNLSSLRELVCYNMKISGDLFEEFLDEAYKANIEGTLRIRISLEVDKLPEQTRSMYLKREPVMVAGKYRNIIAIDVNRGDKNHE